MKNFILILALLVIENTSAQIITDIYPGGVRPPNTYFKDTQNVLNAFVGTWVYQNANTSLTLKLEKAVMQQVGTSFQDLLYGEYRYVEGGVEKINTLNEIESLLQPRYLHNISGDQILHYDDRPPYNNGAPGSIRVLLYMIDVIKNSIYSVYARISNSISPNGNPLMIIQLDNDGYTAGPSNPDPLLDALGMPQVYVGQTIPNGTYIMEKQP
jgi:hypothetical protein